MRLVDVALPSAAGSTDHHVELVADVDVDLRRWRIEWRPADSSAPWETYHVVPDVDRTIPAGGVVRVHGGLATGTASSGRTTWFGGTVGTVPTTGIVVRVLDAQGAVRHERAAMPPGSLVPCRVVADGDLTRAYLVPATRSSGWWSLSMTYARDLGPGEPVRSVAGSTTPEVATISFRAP